MLNTTITITITTKGWSLLLWLNCRSLQELSGSSLPEDLGKDAGNHDDHLDNDDDDDESDYVASQQIPTSGNMT